jgi:RNA polymerase sigma-70 factor (ECF subfamily)
MEFTDGETWQVREVADQADDVEKHYVKRENAERLRRAICHLKPHLRAVVEIQQSKDGRVKEIADHVGISIAATKSRLLRARTVLRRALI